MNRKDRGNFERHHYYYAWHYMNRAVEHSRDDYIELSVATKDIKNRLQLNGGSLQISKD
jgi:hypothetical protein